MSSPRHRATLWILVATLLMAGVCALAISVQAKRDTPSTVKPYDPLPHW